MTIVVEIFNRVIVAEISTDELALVLLIVPCLYPTPVCSADNSVFMHDYEWPGDVKCSRDCSARKTILLHAGSGGSILKNSGKSRSIRLLLAVAVCYYLPK